MRGTLRLFIISWRSGDCVSMRGNMKTVRTTTALLRQFTAAEPELGVSEVARRMGLDKATVHRALKALCTERFVEQDPVTKRYRLGLAVLDIAAARLASFGFLAGSAIEIRQLSEEIGESVAIHVPDRHEMVCLDFAEAAQPVRVSFYVGERFPVHVTSSGLAALSTMPEEQWSVLLVQAKRAYGPAGPDEAQMLSLLNAAKNDGYAIADQSYEKGVRAIAVPVCDASGSIICTISVAAPAQRQTVSSLTALAPSLLRTAGRIGPMLSGHRRPIIDKRKS